MNEEQTKKEIGTKNWNDFQIWMRGKTIGINDDKTIDYYEQDVYEYKRQIVMKILTGDLK